MYLIRLTSDLEPGVNVNLIYHLEHRVKGLGFRV